MNKSSTEYTELFGLRYALAHAKASNASQEVLNWLVNRISELESK